MQSSVADAFTLVTAASARLQGGRWCGALQHPRRHPPIQESCACRARNPTPCTSRKVLHYTLVGACPLCTLCRASMMPSSWKGPRRMCEGSGGGRGGPGGGGAQPNTQTQAARAVKATKHPSPECSAVHAGPGGGGRGATHKPRLLIATQQAPGLCVASSNCATTDGPSTSTSHLCSHDIQLSVLLFEQALVL